MNTTEFVKVEIWTHLWQTQSEFGLVFEGVFGHYVSWSAYAQTVSSTHVSLSHVGFGIDSHQVPLLTMHGSSPITASKLN